MTPVGAVEPAGAMGQAHLLAKHEEADELSAAFLAALGKASPPVAAGAMGADEFAVDARTSDEEPVAALGALLPRAERLAGQAARPPASRESVDPSAFVDLLTTMVSVEGQDGAPRELRVGLGPGAWPVAGVLLVREANGTLSLSLSARPEWTGALVQGSQQLKRRLQERGLPVTCVRVVDDA